MFANKYLTIVLALFAGQAAAQDALKSVQAAQSAQVPTIGQLAEQARLKRQAEDSLRAGASAPGAASGQAGGMPAGMVIVPSSQIINGATAASGGSVKAPSVEKKAHEKKAPPAEFIPVILGTYKQKSGEYSVELGEVAGNERFSPGQVTPSGWTILAIGAKTVRLGKIDPKNGVSKQISLQVSGM
jgi:hypothetical protein